MPERIDDKESTPKVVTKAVFGAVVDVTCAIVVLTFAWKGSRAGLEKIKNWLNGQSKREL